jgi:hypothetical protein
VEQHNPSEPPDPTLAHASKRKTINDSGNLAIKYRAPAQMSTNLANMARVFGGKTNTSAP